MASAVAGIQGYSVSGNTDLSLNDLGDLRDAIFFNKDFLRTDININNTSLRGSKLRKTRHQDPVGYIWSEGNKVYLQTINGFEMTSIKLYFENDVSYNAFVQYQENTIINAFGNYAWTVVPNNQEKSLFFYGTTT